MKKSYIKRKVNKMVKLWDQQTEKKFFTTALNLTTKEQLFYKTKDGKFVAYWPKGYDGPKSTLQSRNSLIGNFTEKWTVDLLKDYAQTNGLFAIQGVICEEIGLTKQSPGDVVLCKKDSIVQNAKDIIVIFEVKMSVVWNWEYDNKKYKELGDFNTHQGNPGLLRSDSMLKAIGKSINIRVSGSGANKIPIVILGNTPITKSYYEKVDHLKKNGIIQGFWSVNSKPRDKIDTIKETKEQGFLRIDSYNELIGKLNELLNQELVFFSSMRSIKQLGEIIVTANKEDSLEKKAEKFLELIRKDD